jgi:hypothetical protein
MTSAVRHLTVEEDLGPVVSELRTMEVFRVRLLGDQPYLPVLLPGA